MNEEENIKKLQTSSSRGISNEIMHCECINPDFRTLPYEDAVVECAKRGSIVLPVKDPEIHSFITQWASITGGDVWIGLQRKRWSQYLDDNPAYNQPLQVWSPTF